MAKDAQRLKELLSLNINKISDDSRIIEKNDIFVAVKGEHFDGHDYISNAIKKGAIAVIYEQGDHTSTKEVKFLKVRDSREALAIIASHYYGNAHQKIKLIGITGTNGKTTTAEITYQLLNKLGRKTGLISTVSAKFPGMDFDTGYHVTTPDALTLHRLIREMGNANCEFIIVETTSHGIDQKRTYGLNYEISAITNITPEHLDYHKTFKNYIDTKTKIFKQSKNILLNKWDPSLVEELKRLPKNKKCKIVNYKNIKFPDEFIKKFPGQYNMENAAIAFNIVWYLLGKQNTEILSDLENVTGRMEKISNNRNLEIIIDFAHDDTSLEKVLREARKITKNNLIHVFGCAGLRDKLKRPRMGTISTKYADKTVITAEDPRTEDLNQINEQIVSGIDQDKYLKNKDFYIVCDRQEAISFAINNLASAGDTVIITGKGHERSMCFGATEYPWSDQNAVVKALS